MQIREELSPIINNQTEEGKGTRLLFVIGLKTVRNASPFSFYCWHPEQFIRRREPVCRIDRRKQYFFCV